MNSIKKIAITSSAVALMLASVAGSAFAASDNYCGSSSNGCAESSSHTICSGHGSFGAFGKDNNFAGGANGQLTGANNSELCGNPQGNP